MLLCQASTSRSAPRERLHSVSVHEPFEHIPQLHGAAVLRVCRAVLGLGADANDAWSETFLAALQAWPDLPAGVNVEAWLVGVARHKAVDIVRAPVRRAVPVSELPERPSQLGNPDEEGIALWRAVAALPTRQRLAVAYHYLGGLPHTETAQLIGGTPDAVRRASADGLKTLRSAYRTSEALERGAR